MPEIDPR